MSCDGVIIRPMGGVGNQLFIYGTGFSLAAAHGVPLKVDKSWYGQNKDRNFALDGFVADDRVLHLSDQTFPARIHQFLSPISHHLASQWWRIAGPSRNYAKYSESSVAFQDEVAALKPPVALSGYFHSWRYLESSKDTLRGSIRNLKSESLWLTNTRQSLDDLGPWAAIHVRRGDFLSLSNRSNHGALGPGYYSAAIAKLKQTAGSMPLVLFTDDTSSAFEALPRGFSPDYVVTDPLNHNDIETLVLMSEASGIIIANSTFSWWSAWLGDTHNRTVITPAPWSRTEGIVRSDFVLPTWVSVPADFY